MIALAWINTQEWIRQKFFQVIFFVAFIYLGLSSLVGTLSFVEQTRITTDFGLAGLEIICVFIAAFISTHALYRDIEKKTIQVVLSRPIPRWHLLMGYLGCIKVLNLLVIIGLGLIIGFLFSPANSSLNLVIALAVILLKSLVVGSFGLFMSVRARPMFSFVITLSFWALTYLVPDFMFFAEKNKSDLLIAVGKVFNWIVPRFYVFNWKDYHFLTSHVSVSEVLWVWLHCMSWIFGLLFLAAIAFRRKEIV